MKNIPKRRISFENSVLTRCYPVRCPMSILFQSLLSRYLDVRWTVIVVDASGKEYELVTKDVFYYTTSISVCWNDMALPVVGRLSSCSIYAQCPLFRDAKGKAKENRFAACLWFYLDVQTCIHRLCLAISHELLLHIAIYFYKQIPASRMHATLVTFLSSWLVPTNASTLAFSLYNQ